MYLAFTGLPQGIAATLEGYFGPHWYNQWSSKETLARRLLVEHGLDPVSVSAIPQGESFARLVEHTGGTAADLTRHMFATYDVGLLWWVFGAIGVTSAVGLYIYGRMLPMLRAQQLA
jgi:hypothetical protein